MNGDYELMEWNFNMNDHTLLENVWHIIMFNHITLYENVV